MSLARFTPDAPAEAYLRKHGLRTDSVVQPSLLTSGKSVQQSFLGIHHATLGLRLSGGKNDVTLMEEQLPAVLSLESAQKKKILGSPDEKDTYSFS